MAQNITRLEYFFDTDPGYGNATNIAISSSPDIALNFTANLSGLSTGIHQLYVRAKDANAKWGLLNSRSVVVQNNVQGGPLHNIVRLEYFFDLDPGVGNAISIPITSGTDVTKNFTIPFTGIADGFHSIYMRAQDATGIWSLLSTRFVFVQPSTLFGSPANVSRIEYFIDTDPGFGGGTPVSYSASTDVSQNTVIDLTGTTPGFHTLYIRARNGP